VGDVIGKIITTLHRAKISGIVLDTSDPVTLKPRSETAESKSNLILLASCRVWPKISFKNE
jgi:hypothetical protein